eukprot:941870-Rhodomonas_salina.2
MVQHYVLQILLYGDPRVPTLIGSRRRKEESEKGVLSLPLARSASACRPWYRHTRCQYRTRRSMWVGSYGTALR